MSKLSTERALDVRHWDERLFSFRTTRDSSLRFSNGPECPADAIVADSALTDGDRHFLILNSELAQLWPVLNESKEAPADADEWNGRADKFALLEPIREVDHECC